MAQSTPSSNFGTSQLLEVDASPVQNILLKFNVSGLSGTVTNARLRLHAVDGSNSGGSVFRTASTSWSETGVTWNNAPAADAAPLGTFPAVAAGNWYEVNVTSLVTGNGTVGVRIRSSSGDGADFASKERGGGLAAQLIVTTGSSPPPPPPGALTFSTIADTFVAQATPTSNFGTSQLLEVDNSPIQHILLKFNVSGLSGTVTDAKLRIHALEGSNVGGIVYRTASTSWSETGVTWNTAPAADPSPLGSIGAVAAGTWYQVDVDSLVTGNGTFGVRITSTSGDGADYASKERGGGLAAQLVVTTGSSPPPPPPGTTVIAGAGDIADSGFASTRTAALLDSINPSIVVALGDLAYPNGTAANFADYYEPTWGRHKAKTRPAVGNHEYQTSGATPYYNYFGSAAGPAGQGWYSYDIAGWHMVVLNSNCAAVGGCGPGSPQYTWLQNDLASTSATCVGAYWHHPRFASGNYANDATYQPFWELLYAEGAEFVLSGHDHNYQRYARLTATGQVDATNGVRQFIVGTGGRQPFHPVDQPGPSTRQAANDNTLGVLKLSLRAGSYDWQFVPEAGKTFADSGTDTCSQATNPPPGGGALTFTSSADTFVAQATPTSNFGTSQLLEVDNSPIQHILLKFNVSGLSGSVTDVKLRLHALDGSTTGGSVFRTASTSWSETGVTWNTAPAADPSPLGSIGAVAAGTWYQVDVDSLVTGNGTFGVRITSTSGDGADYASKERGGGLAAQLVVTTGSSPPPPPPGGGTLTFTAGADTFVAQGTPTSNFGTSQLLEVDNSPIQHILLKFNVSGLSGSVTDVKLRLHALDGSTTGGSVFRTASTSWSETGVTWNTAPAADPSPLGSLGPVSPGTWYQVDVDSLVTGNGTFGVRITSTSGDGADYASRERGGGLTAQLVVTTG